MAIRAPQSQVDVSLEPNDFVGDVRALTVEFELGLAVLELLLLLVPAFTPLQL